MIKNLNSLTFFEYGEVLEGSLEERGSMLERGSIARLLPISCEQMRMYRAKRELCLDREEGICVLSVAVDKERTSYFYLDKPVRLKQHVFFALIPHGKSCSIKLYMDNEESYETLELLNGECFKHGEAAMGRRKSLKPPFLNITRMRS